MFKTQNSRMALITTVMVAAAVIGMTLTIGWIGMLTVVGATTMSIATIFATIWWIENGTS